MFVNPLDLASGIPLDSINVYDIPTATILPLPVRREAECIEGCQMTPLSTGVTIFVRGSVAEWRQKIQTARTAGFAGDVYTPVLASSGAGVIGMVGNARWVQIGKRVHVIFKVAFTPAAVGVPELLSFTLPAINTGGQPSPVPFTAANQLVGSVQGGTAAADFADIQPRARAAGSLGEFSLDQTTAGASEWTVVAAYDAVG